MRIIPLFVLCLMLCGLPFTSSAATGARTVRGIAFAASHEHGPTDPKLAAYESILRSNLRFESFRYVGESSATLSPGGTASLSVGGVQVSLQCDKDGNVRAQHGGAQVTLGGKPNVFMNGSTGVIIIMQ